VREVEMATGRANLVEPAPETKNAKHRYVEDDPNYVPPPSSLSAEEQKTVD